ncbi:MAG: CAP domain-containing protein [Clostridium sp.]
MKYKLLVTLTTLAILSGCANGQKEADIKTPDVTQNTQETPKNEIPKSNDIIPEVVTPKLPETNENKESVPQKELPKEKVIPKVEVPPKSEEPNKVEEHKQVDEPKNNNFISNIEQEIFQKVNEERSKQGIPLLTYNKTMEKYGRIKAKDMGDKGYFAHENPNGELITVQMNKDGVGYNAWGENIAYSTGDINAIATQFMNMWMNSEGHRKNILSDNYTSIGIGISKHGDEIYGVQEFYR